MIFILYDIHFEEIFMNFRNFLFVKFLDFIINKHIHQYFYLYVYSMSTSTHDI